MTSRVSATYQNFAARNYQTLLTVRLPLSTTRKVTNLKHEKLSPARRSNSDKSRIHKLAQRLEAHQIQDILRRYQAGESSNAIAADLCISKGAVLNLLDAHQVTKPSRSVSEEQKQRIC